MADSSVFGLVMLAAFLLWAASVYMALHSRNEED